MMTSSREGRPRSFRPARKSAQVSADSPLPGARPLNLGLPSGGDALRGQGPTRPGGRGVSGRRWHPGTGSPA
jgi:hypothetical protein